MVSGHPTPRSQLQHLIRYRMTSIVGLSHIRRLRLLAIENSFEFHNLLVQTISITRQCICVRAGQLYQA